MGAPIRGRHMSEGAPITGSTHKREHSSQGASVTASTHQREHLSVGTTGQAHLRWEERRPRGCWVGPVQTESGAELFGP